MKRPKTNSKKISWFGIVSVFMLAIALMAGGVSTAQAATGSFDRDAYLPSLNDTNDYDRAFISVTDTSVTTSTTDTITVTVKAGSSAQEFVLKETGATTTVFTTTGSTQPTHIGIGTTTGYVEQLFGSHFYPAFGTSSIGVSMKSFAIQSGGNATTNTECVLNVESGQTLQLLYGNSTLDTAAIGFNGTNDSSITFTKGSSWGTDDATGVAGQSANIILSLTDPDENLNPKIKDAIGIQDGFSLGLTTVPSSRVEVEAIDQNTGSRLQVSGTDVIVRNVFLTETGLNTGIFTAQGKIYGTTSTTVTATGNLIVTGTNTINGYTGTGIVLGSSTGAPRVEFRIIETNASSGRIGLFFPGSVTAGGGGFLPYGTATLGFTTGSNFSSGFGTSSWSPTTVVALATNTSAFGTPTAEGSLGTSTGGLLKLIEGNNYVLVKVLAFTGTTTAPTAAGPAIGAMYEGTTAGLTSALGTATGSVTFSMDSFVLTTPRSGDSIKVSYLDELTSGGSVGTISSKTTFGATGETGTLSVDKTTADINDVITITVVDGNLNSNTGSKESIAIDTWKGLSDGTTTNSRGDRLVVKNFSRAGGMVHTGSNISIGSNTISLSHPDGFKVGSQSIRISNTDNSLIWKIAATSTSSRVLFGDPTTSGSSTFSLGTQSTSTIALVKGSSATADSFLSSAITSSFIATADAVEDTVEISPDGTHWIAVPMVETGANSSTFIGTIGFDCTAARVTTNTTKTAAQTFSDFTGTSTITFHDAPAVSSFIGTGSVVRISDGIFSEVKEVVGVNSATLLTVEKMSNSAYYTPWKTFVQVIGNDMDTNRLDTVSGTERFRIGGFYGATYRLRYNDVLNVSGAYTAGDTLAVTTSNVGFTSYEGSLAISPSGTVGLNSEIVVTLVDQDLNTSTGSAQSTFHDATANGATVNLNEVGMGNPTGTSSGNISNSSPRKNGGIAKQIFASRATVVTSTDFSSQANTVSVKLVETASNTGTFLGTLKLTGLSGSSTDNTVSPVALKVSNGDTITIFYNDSPSAAGENNLSAYTTVSMSAVGGLGSMNLSKSEAFLSGDNIVVTLIDNDLNSTSGLDAGSVKCTSSSDDTGGAGRFAVLTETGVNTGTFKGTFVTGASSSAQANAPTIRAVANGSITVKYSDTSPAQDVTAQVTTKNYGAVLAFTADAVALGANAVVSLYDPESNSSISSANNVNASVKSTTDSTGTTVRMTETGNDTGSFLGTIAVSTDSSLSNTRIKATVGDTLTVTFTDNPDANGNISTVTDTATAGAAAATPTPTPGPATPTPTPGPATPTPTPGPTPTTGVIVGTVSTGGVPIPGATVSTDTGGFTATTGPDGTYTIPDVTAGAYTVTASAAGFDSASQTVTVTAGSAAVADFNLTPSAAPTPTVTPTPTVVCEAEAISVSPTSLTLKRNKSGDVTVTVTGADDCAVEGETVTATINSAGKKRISVSPTSDSTDENGQATFTITAKKKTGSARVTFKAGAVKKSMTVKVRK